MPTQPRGGGEWEWPAPQHGEPTTDHIQPRFPSHTNEHGLKKLRDSNHFFIYFGFRFVKETTEDSPPSVGMILFRVETSLPTTSSPRSLNSVFSNNSSGSSSESLLFALLESIKSKKAITPQDCQKWASKGWEFRRTRRKPSAETKKIWRPAVQFSVHGRDGLPTCSRKSQGQRVGESRGRGWVGSRSWREWKMGRQLCRGR